MDVRARQQGVGPAGRSGGASRRACGRRRIVPSCGQHGGTEKPHPGCTPSLACIPESTARHICCRSVQHQPHSPAAARQAGSQQPVCRHQSARVLLSPAAARLTSSHPSCQTEAPRRTLRRARPTASREGEIIRVFCDDCLKRAASGTSTKSDHNEAIGAGLLITRLCEIRSPEVQQKLLVAVIQSAHRAVV